MTVSNKSPARPSVAVLDAAVASNAKAWDLPAFNLSGPAKSNPGVSKPGAEQAHTAEALDQLQKAAYDEGFAEGLADGKNKAQKDNQLVLQKLTNILENLSNPLAELDEQVTRQIVRVSTMIAEHLVRREINWDPDAVLDLAREAVASINPQPREVVLRLHPEDAESLKRVLPAEEGKTWQILADAGLDKGDLQVQADAVRVDARVATRVAALAKEFKAG